MPDAQIISKVKLPESDSTYEFAVKWGNVREKPNVATEEYVDQHIAANDAMRFKGTIGDSESQADITELPAAHRIGDTWKAVTVGYWAGQVCDAGDLIICVETGTVASNDDWTVAQGNLDGAVTGPASSTANHIATFNNATGKVIKDSGYTIATSVPANAVFTDTKVQVVRLI